jgi:hypothetical protein
VWDQFSDKNALIAGSDFLGEVDILHGHDISIILSRRTKKTLRPRLRPMLKQQRRQPLRPTLKQQQRQPLRPRLRLMQPQPFLQLPLHQHHLLRWQIGEQQMLQR